MFSSYSGDLRVHVCRAVGSDPFILLSNRATIRGFDLQLKKYRTLVPNVESAVAMDFLHKFVCEISL